MPHHVCLEKVFRPLFLWVSNANFICQQVGSLRCQKLIDRRVLSKQSRSRLSKPKQTASSQGVICHPMNGKPYDWRLTLIAENSGQAPGQKTTSDQINSIQIKSTQTRKQIPIPVPAAEYGQLWSGYHFSAGLDGFGLFGFLFSISETCWRFLYMLHAISAPNATWQGAKYAKMPHGQLRIAAWTYT